MDLLYWGDIVGIEYRKRVIDICTIQGPVQGFKYKQIGIRE